LSRHGTCARRAGGRLPHRRRPTGDDTMSRRIRVGVVGGGIGLNHIRSYRELPDLYSVDAFCDVDPSRADRVRRDFGIERIATSLDELLDVDLDVVDICTPSSLHYAQASKALAAGRHVVVE